MSGQRIIFISKRLRPLRLAFLVRPNDKLILKRIFQINSCIWGGQFNPIIPVYKKTPRNWEKKPLRSPSARIVIRGYLDTFEPDFLVVEEKRVAEGLDFDAKRVITLDDICNSNEDDPIAYGVDVTNVYDELYEREFKFKRRHPIKVVLPLARDKDTRLLISACFGEFPETEKLDYFRRNYINAFEATEEKITSKTFVEIFTKVRNYPLRIGSAQIDVQSLGWNSDPSLFYMDASSFLDVLDFWNLRAVGRRILPVPRQWSGDDDFMKQCSEYIAQNFRPYKHDRKMMHGTTLICSRSCSFMEMEEFSASLKLPGSGAISLQHWYPRIWDEWARDKDQAVRCHLTAKEGHIEVLDTDGRVNFEDLAPEFVDKYGGRGEPRWANVIELRDYSQQLDSAPVIPPGVPDLNRVTESYGLTPIWATREGITIACEHSGWTHRWKLPTAEELFRKWVQAKGYELAVSSAGKIAMKIVQSLGSLRGIKVLGNEDVIKQLNDMAHQRAEVEIANNSGEYKSKVRAGTVSRQAWWKLFMRVNKGNQSVAERHLDSLIKNRVLKIGLRLQCPECTQHTWFDLEEISEKITCERCLRKFDFPATRPPAEEAWHYRVIGPFSVENFAQGSYCVALAAHFLGNPVSNEITFIPSFCLKSKDGQLLEADFGVFLRRNQYEKTNPVLIFGECKSYDRFLPRDIKRMNRMAQAFPGSVLAFCTMRKQLEPTEKKLISNLARKGRKHLRAEKWHSPVLVLTAVELFSDFGPPHCWEEAGNPYKSFAQSYRGHEGIQELCNVTQQMHLGMESYWTWYESERIKRQNRRDRKRSNRISTPVQKLTSPTTHTDLTLPDLHGNQPSTPSQL